MKKLFSKLLCFVMLLLTVFGFASCEPEKSENERTREFIRITSGGIEVPLDAELIYHVHDASDGFVNGGQFNYTVFRFESEPIDWLQENAFQDSLEEKSEQFKRSFLWALDTKPNTMQDIPQQYLPNFDNVYFCLKSEDVYFLYLTQELLLIAINPNT